MHPQTTRYDEAHSLEVAAPDRRASSRSSVSVARALGAYALVLASGCDPGTGLPDDARPFDPPAIYQGWWEAVTLEADLRAPFPEVSWYEVAGGGWPDGKGGTVYGLWLPDGRIYLAEAFRVNPWAVKHEMLHELLRGDLAHAHPLFTKYRAGPVDF